jgi:AraC-like DNA-binding protein
VDPLSDVLSLLHVESATSGRLEAGGNWALQSSAQEHITFCALLSGPCWLITSDRDEPIEMKPGDCLLATDSAAVRLCSDPSMSSADRAKPLAASVPAVLRIGDGAETSLIGARFRFDEAYAKSILSFLPATIYIRAGSPSAASLQTILYKLQDEIDVPRLGRELVVDHLVHLALVQAMRGYLTCKEQCPRSGWLGALADRQISAALRLMHEEVTRRWTVAELGAAVGMSRSSFAQRFKALVGIPPLDYLTQWRIHLAGRMLQDGGSPISVVAAEFGYESESAFSTAFKRVMGCAPREFRSRRRNGVEIAPALPAPRPRVPARPAMNGHQKVSIPSAE